MKKKALAFAAMACSVAMLLSACGGSNSNAASGDTAGSNIITAYNSEPQNPLIPGNTNETGGGKPVDLLFSRLVSFDKDGKASNEVAESITPNDDATQYTIKIKSGWKFTDGTPVTAESFTKAWSYVANAKNAQKCSSFFSAIAGYDDLQKDGLKGDEQLSGLKVVDDTTFTVDLNQSDSVFPIKVGYSAFAPLPESFYKDPKAFGEKPVSNGPYKLDHWDHNKEIALVKNPDYKGNEQPKNDGVTFKVYTDDSAAYRDIQAGNLDVMESVPAAFTKTFKTDKKVQAYSEAGSVIQTFTIPSSLDHFKNDEEGQLRRQAISMAINRDQLIDKVLNGHSPVYYCNWMDIASHTPEYNYTKTWHYLNIDEGQTLETMPRNPKGDVLTLIKPRQHALFWADGMPNRGTFHVNFTLDPDKENYIALYDSNGKTLIDEVTIPAGQLADRSYAREKDGSANWVVKGGGEHSYVTPSTNNMTIDKNPKIENFKKHDSIGIGMAIIAMSVVFIGLVLLYLSFKAVGNIAVRLGKKNAMKATGITDKTEAKEKNLGSHTGEETAAIAMALHEYLNDAHDVEDMILTINKVKRTYSPWSSKIYTLRQTPRR
mgnify:CR=1 FL=1